MGKCDNGIMNVKITGNSVTFKITEEELNTLLSGASLEEELAIGTNRFLMGVSTAHYISSGISQTHLDLSSDDTLSRFILHTGMDEIEKLSGMGKNRDGLSVRSGNLDVSLQVDIRKDSRERKQA